MRSAPPFTTKPASVGRGVAAGPTRNRPRQPLRQARIARDRNDESAGICRADAVYTISPALPQGLHTIDAGFPVCERGPSGIPTV